MLENHSKCLKGKGLESFKFEQVKKQSQDWRLFGQQKRVVKMNSLQAVGLLLCGVRPFVYSRDVATSEPHEPHAGRTQPSNLISTIGFQPSDFVSTIELHLNRIEPHRTASNCSPNFIELHRTSSQPTTYRP